MKNKILRKLFLGVILCVFVLMGCGESDTQSVLPDDDDEVDYFDAASFEQALNDGVDVLGKVVIFEVTSYEPGSALGIDCWAGEHLNFISEEELDVVPGDCITGKVTNKPSKVLDSWKIPYSVMAIDKSSNDISADEIVLDTPNDVADTAEIPLPNPEQEEMDNKESEGDSAAVNTEEVKTEDNTTTAQETSPTYNISDLSATMYATTKVNIRSIPDTSGNKLGSLEANEAVIVTGIVDNGWYRINRNGEGFVRGDYLTAEQVITPAAVPDTTDIAPAVAAAAAGTAVAAGGGNAEPDVIVPGQADTEGDLVWVPVNGGTKYHSYASCSGMENPIQITREHAEANGYTPCKKCH